MTTTAYGTLRYGSCQPSPQISVITRPRTGYRATVVLPSPAPPGSTRPR